MFSLESAKIIVKWEKKYGTTMAVEQLECFGFDCFYYWDEVSKYISEQDANTLLNPNDKLYDAKCIEARNELYNRLGISEIMKKAYSEVGL